MNETKISGVLEMELCDLYFPKKTTDEFINKYILLFDKTFKIKISEYYLFAGLSIDRISNVAIIMKLRQKSIMALGCPIKYRENDNLTDSKACNLAIKQLNKFNLKFSIIGNVSNNPMYFEYPYKINNYSDSYEEKNGLSSIFVDRLTGELLSFQKVREYMYDYSGIFI